MSISTNDTSANNGNAFRELPSVEKLLRRAELVALVEDDGLPPALLTELAREQLEAARQNIRQGQAAPPIERLVAGIEQQAAELTSGSLINVINAAGVVLHTNLGRAPLSSAAVAAMQAVAGSYSNLEYDLGKGERGSRLSHISGLIARVTGAEAGIAVNNCAAAVFMVLTAFAKDREVILSRGQAVEIGGGFRVPDVISQGGAKLVEVGTTNKTYLRDYEAAITDNTAMLLRVHSSNFRVIGFTHNTSLEEMAELAKQHSLILADDLGSGALIDTAQYGLMHEPTVQGSLKAGAHLVMFSGDKLLGGPQAGIIAGRADLIERLKKHPLARALRLDKMTLAALQATFIHYLKGEATSQIPVWQMIARPVADIEREASDWRDQLADLWPDAHILPGQSTIGGGSLPGETLPTYLLALPVPFGQSANALTQALRRATPPVIVRVENNTLLLDPRTVLPGQSQQLIKILSTQRREDAK